MNVKDYGIKKSWNGWQTYAYVSDGTKLGLMPIDWATSVFKTKQQATSFIKDLAKKNSWNK
jgi:hypothetical protein